MALLWESLATREVKLLQHSMRERFAIIPGCAWVNYVRCHDDIGWTFDDVDAAHLGINGYDHRRFLNDFYTGRFAGSFPAGLPFQENPRTGGCAHLGTCASLAGLEAALLEDASPADVALAVRRILMIHSIILSIGGIPLIYLGDEIGALNDYGYRDDPAKAGDSRWVHRPAADPAGAMRLAPIRAPWQGRCMAGCGGSLPSDRHRPPARGARWRWWRRGIRTYSAMCGRERANACWRWRTSASHAQTISANVIRTHGLGSCVPRSGGGCADPYRGSHPRAERVRLAGRGIAHCMKQSAYCASSDAPWCSTTAHLRIHTAHTHCTIRTGPAAPRQAHTARRSAPARSARQAPRNAPSSAGVFRAAA